MVFIYDFVVKGDLRRRRSKPEISIFPQIQEEEVLKDEEDVGDNDVENEGEEKSDDITREVIDLDDGDDDDGDDGSKKKRSSSRRRSGKILLPFFTNYACMQWPPPHE